MKRASQDGGTRAVVEWIAARSFFPIVLGGALFWAIAEIESGVAPARAIGLPTLLSYLIIASAERLFYWESDWLHSQGDLKVDIGHLLVSGLVTIQLLEIPIRLGTIGLATWLAGGSGRGIWPTEWAQIRERCRSDRPCHRNLLRAKQKLRRKSRVASACEFSTTTLLGRRLVRSIPRRREFEARREFGRHLLQA